MTFPQEEQNLDLQEWGTIRSTMPHWVQTYLWYPNCRGSRQLSIFSASATMFGLRCAPCFSLNRSQLRLSWKICLMVY